MPDFLVHSYLGDPELSLDAVGTRLRPGSPQLLYAIHVPEDEIVVTLWRAEDTDAVGRATRELGLALDRISRARDLIGGDADAAR